MMRRLIPLLLLIPPLWAPPAVAQRAVNVGYFSNHYEPLVSSEEVLFILDDWSTTNVAMVENSAVELKLDDFATNFEIHFTIQDTRGTNTFSAAPGSGLTINFAGPIGRRDEATTINFGKANGLGALTVNFQDIVGGLSADRATTINFYDDAQLWGNAVTGTVSGHVRLNNMGDHRRTTTAFDTFGRADLDSSLLIGGTNSTRDSLSNAGSAVHISNIIGGKNGRLTAIIAEGTPDGTDFVFSVDTPIKDGAFAFYYNGSGAEQGNLLKIGSHDSDTQVVIGGTNGAAVAELDYLLGGLGGHATSLTIDGLVAVRVDSAQDRLNIVNNNEAAGSVILETIKDGVLNVGGVGSNIILKQALAENEALRLGSLDNSRAAVIETGLIAPQSGVSNASRIALGNAVLKVASDGSGLNHAAGFRLDSSSGASRLDAASVLGDFDFALGRTPTIAVGGGGHVIIENNNLIYDGPLESGGGADFDGGVTFSGAGENRLIFYSLGQNSFNGGFDVDDPEANIEFVGSSFLDGFTSGLGESRLAAGDIFLTGLDNAADPLAASRISFGNGEIDMGDSRLHLNNSLYFRQASGHIGGLGRVAGLIMGDGAGAIGGHGANITLFETSLSAETALVGPWGARINAPVAVGGYSLLTDSLDIAKTLTIGGKTVINGYLQTRAAPEPAFYFMVKESLILTDAAKLSHIAPGTIFMIDPALARLLFDGEENFLVLEAEAGSASITSGDLAALAANLTFSDANLDSSLSGYFGFDPAQRLLGHGLSAAIDEPGGEPGGPVRPPRLPSYALPLWEAAQAHNPGLGLYLARGPGLSDARYYQEVAQVMGNTLNAALIFDNTGAHEVMRRLFYIGRAADPLQAPKNPAYRITDGLWLRLSAGRLSNDEDYREGLSGLKSRSQGLTLGYDLEAKRYLRAGIFGHLSSSEMKMDWQRIESESTEAGFYGQLYLPWGFMLNSALSYSWQGHSSRRDMEFRGVSGADFNQRLETYFMADAVNFQAELKRPLALGDFQAAPSLAYIYRGMLLEPFLETSSLNAPECNLAVMSAGADFDVKQLKAGAEISWRKGRLLLSGRAHYLQNMGDERPESLGIFAYSANPQIFNMHGAELDREMLDLGLSASYAPEDYGLSFELDYEGRLGDKTKSHSVALNISYNF